MRCAGRSNSATRSRADEQPSAPASPWRDGRRNGAPSAATRPGQRLITMMLLAAAALDLTRCGLVLVTARHPAPAAGLIAAGLAAAAVSIWTAGDAGAAAAGQPGPPC